jgi:hypothetical protein
MEEMNRPKSFQRLPSTAIATTEQSGDLEEARSKRKKRNVELSTQFHTSFSQRGRRQCRYSLDFT